MVVDSLSPAERRDGSSFWYTGLRHSEYSEKQLAGRADWLTAEADREKECLVSLKDEDEGSPWVWADHLCELVGN